MSLYIHLPWCEKKCPYCDFNSYAARNELPEKDYVDALLADLAQDLPQVWGRKIETVFIGGGTPSLFSAEAIHSLLAGVRALTNPRPGIEITMEANPGSAERVKFAEFRAAGVNRLSIGVQSFNDTHLKALGRVHDSAQAVSAVEAAQHAGFEAINLDLMFGLPNQSIGNARADIEQAVALQPQHISYYQLTLEPNTLFYQRPPRYRITTAVGRFSKTLRRHWPVPPMNNTKFLPTLRVDTAAHTTSITGNSATTLASARVRTAR